MYNTFKLSGKRTITGQNSGSFLINTEGVISNILEKSLRYKDRVRNSIGVSYPVFILTRVSIKKYYQKVEII